VGRERLVREQGLEVPPELGVQRAAWERAGCTVVVQQPRMALGPPLTQRTLRKIAVEHLVGLGVAQVRRAAAIVDAERGWYRVERPSATGAPRVQAVAAGLPCSRSHAGRLVAQARAAGQLRRTSPGRPAPPSCSN
jgi:hypothetical protein